MDNKKYKYLKFFLELISIDKIKVFIASEEPTKLEGNSKKVRIPNLVPAKYDENPWYSKLKVSMKLLMR